MNRNGDPTKLSSKIHNIIIATVHPLLCIAADALQTNALSNDKQTFHCKDGKNAGVVMKKFNELVLSKCKDKDLGDNLLNDDQCTSINKSNDLVKLYSNDSNHGSAIERAMQCVVRLRLDQLDEVHFGEQYNSIILFVAALEIYLRLIAPNQLQMVKYDNACQNMMQRILESPFKNPLRVSWGHSLEEIQRRIKHKGLYSPLGMVLTRGFEFAPLSMREVHGNGYAATISQMCKDMQNESFFRRCEAPTQFPFLSGLYMKHLKRHSDKTRKEFNIELSKAGGATETIKKYASSFWGAFFKSQSNEDEKTHEDAVHEITSILNGTVYLPSYDQSREMLEAGLKKVTNLDNIDQWQKGKTDTLSLVSGTNHFDNMVISCNSQTLPTGWSTILYMDQYCIGLIPGNPNDSTLICGINSTSANKSQDRGLCSRLHVLVIPRSRKWNAVALQAADDSLLKHMDKIGRRLVSALARADSFRPMPIQNKNLQTNENSSSPKCEQTPMTLEEIQTFSAHIENDTKWMSSEPIPYAEGTYLPGGMDLAEESGRIETSELVSAFQAYPNNSIPYLHLHVFASHSLTNAGLNYLTKEVTIEDADGIEKTFKGAMTPVQHVIRWIKTKPSRTATQ
jgi:hypothetical protein